MILTLRAIAGGLIVVALALTATTQPSRAQAPNDELRMSVVEDHAVFKKSDFVSIEVVTDQDRPALSITLSPQAAQRFAELTAKHVGKRLQIVVGDRILTTPIIQTPITGGRVLITGPFSVAEAEALATRLR